MELSSWLRKQLEQAPGSAAGDGAGLRGGADAEADALCGASYGERSPERVNRRNGYRERDWDTREVEKLVQQLGVERMSRSQVSRLAKSLDQIVEDFRTRPLDGAPYPYLVLDALEVKCREGGRTVNACVVHAVAVNTDGFRESLGLDVVTAEDGAAWLAFLRSLVARVLTGVKLVTRTRTPA
jgi:putative transposase